MKASYTILGKAMKPYSILAVVTLMLLASCSSRLSTKRYYDDDVYFSSKDLRNYTPPAYTSPTDTGSYLQNSGSNTTAAATPNYQNGQQVIDDYYDYQYASRIRRFYYPSYGMGYYDPWYTNSYWYNYNPYSFGTSIYTTYNFWPNSYTYWGFGNPWGAYNPWAFNPYWGYNNWGYNGWGYNSPWMPYNPYACGWGFGNPYWGGGWGWGNPYFNGFNNGYYNGYYNGFYDGMAYNNYYFNGFDNNSYSYYGPYKQSSTSGSNKVSFAENIQTALGNSGDVLKFTPAVGSTKPTNAVAADKPLSIAPGAQGVKPNALTTAPGVKGLAYDATTPVGGGNLGEKSNTQAPDKTNAVVKPNNPNFNSYKPVQTQPANTQQPAETKPSITGKPIQVFDYSQPAQGNKGNLNANSPDAIKQQAQPAPQQGNFNNKPQNSVPTQQPVNTSRPNRDNDFPSDPVYQPKPANDNRPNYQAPQPAQPDNSRPTYQAPQQSRPDYSTPRSYDNNNNNNRPSYSAPQQTSPSRSNDSRPSYSAPSRSNDSRPSYSAPQQSSPSYSSPRSYDSAPRNSGGGNNGGGGMQRGGGGGRTPR